MLLTNRRGQGLVEYLILLCLIGVSSIAIVSLVGTNVRELYANVANAIQNKQKVDFTTVDQSMYQRRGFDDFTEGAKTGKGNSGLAGGWTH